MEVGIRAEEDLERFCLEFTHPNDKWTMDFSGLFWWKVVSQIRPD